MQLTFSRYKFIVNQYSEIQLVNQAQEKENMSYGNDTDR